MDVMYIYIYIYIYMPGHHWAIIIGWTRMKHEATKMWTNWNGWPDTVLSMVSFCNFFFIFAFVFFVHCVFAVFSKAIFSHLVKMCVWFDVYRFYNRYFHIECMSAVNEIASGNFHFDDFYDLLHVQAQKSMNSLQHTSCLCGLLITMSVARVFKAS